MGKDLFDNLMKILKVENTAAGTTIVSLEVDFELPRGFIAKIHKLIFSSRAYINSFTVGDAVRHSIALVRDPDDITTVLIPNNSVQHDVIADYIHETLVLEITAVGEIFLAGNGFNKIIDFTNLGLDVITARNMRFNSVATTTGGNGTIFGVAIHYTLEKISNEDILNLLDIL